MPKRHPFHGLRASFLCLSVFMLILLSLQGCVVTNTTEYPVVEPEAAYDQLYPYYVSACAVSQIKSKFADPGGSAGHAVIYLKGACLDRSQGYPRIKLCDPQSVDLSDPNSGVGISVNKIFKNVNWMATPGSELFYDGILDEGAVTKTAMQNTLELAHSQDIWHGIEIHEQYKPQSDTREIMIGLLAKDTLGTDFALRFGRHAYCVQLPMEREQLGKIVEYLNELNDSYASGEADYNWDGYSDNCSHAVHNSLANANVWKPQKVSTTKFKQLFNLSVPSNEVIKLGLLIENFPLEKFQKIYHDAAALRSLLEDHWLPARHGALLKYLPIHRDNELYETEENIFVLELPFFRKSKRFVKLFDDSRNTNIRDNLLYYQERYRQILDERPSDWDKPSSVNKSYKEARRKYYEYIEAQLEDVKSKLSKLAEIQAADSSQRTKN